MKYCKRCVQPDTRPDVIFRDGICGACWYEEEKESIDWTEREAELKDIAQWAKDNATTYDCIVGVSGGKDSTFQTFYARDKLGLNPLLVNCVPDGITEVGKANLENLVNHGFDMVQIRTDPKVMRAVTKRAFYEYGNPVKPSEYPLFAVSYIAAKNFNIPLIVQGENSALTLGVGSMARDGNALNVNQEPTLAGGNAEDWVTEDIPLNKLLMYQFPKDLEGIKAIYLQYYAKEWSQVRNADFAIARGLQGRTDNLYDIGRYRRYTALDADVQIVNQMLKYLKFGFGFATDEACYDIREGRLTRDEAIWLVKEYDGKCGQRYIKEFCDYIDITEEEFWWVTDRYVNKKLFCREGDKWVPLFEVGVDYEGA